MTDSGQRFAGVVLAAGSSKRMGENKLFLEIDGDSLLVRAVRNVQAARLYPVVVVAGFEHERVRDELRGFKCEIVLNKKFGGLMSASLHRALWEVPSGIDGIVVVLPDMIHVTAEMVRGVIDAARATPAPLVVSRYGDVTAPPILFRRSLFSELHAWNGEGCGKAVVQAHAKDAIIVDWPEAALGDVDTPQEWIAAQGRAGTAQGG